MIERSRAVALSLSLAALVASTPLSAQTGRWTLVEELRIGSASGGGPDSFGQLRSVVPDGLGRIWAMDTQAAELRVFDAEGRFVRTVGGRGNGSGRFAGPGQVCAFAGPAGEIWTEDGYQRWQSFDSAGAVIAVRQSTSNIRCGGRRWLPDGRFLVTSSERDANGQLAGPAMVAHTIGADGALVSGATLRLPVAPASPNVTSTRPGQTIRLIHVVPFWPRGQTAMTPAGDFWIADGKPEYEIRRQTFAGDTLARIRRTHTPVPIPAAIREQAIRGLTPEGAVAESGFDPNSVPRVYPPFESFMVGSDGRLWVWRTVAGGRIVLDVFSPEGRYLAEASVPAGFADVNVTSVIGDKMYGMVRDPAGTYYAVRFGVRTTGR